MNKRLLLIGGGGHCNSIIDVIENSYENHFSEIAIIDIPEKVDTYNHEYRYIGSDDDLEDLRKIGFTHAFISLGGIGNFDKRIKIYNKLKNIGFIIPNIISKSSISSKRLVIGEGNFIGKGVIINSGVVIGNNTIINTGAILEHDCKVNDFVHISPGTVLSGNVTIGFGSHIGTNTTIIQNIIIEENVIIGAGSVVVRDIQKNTMAYGVPCKKVKEI